MKHHAHKLWQMWTQPTPTASDSANARQVQALLDGLEDPPPNSLLHNLATGFPSALLCVLAAGVLAGALAGASFTPHAAPPVVGAAPPAVSPAVSPGASPQAPAATPPVSPAVAQVNATLTGRHAQLHLLEQQALLLAPAAR